MLINLELLENNYFCFGLDVPYELKKGGIINIKPIFVRDYPKYEWGKQSLEFKKNEINDISIISMSYLDFLIVMIKESKEILEQFNIILNLCLGIENYSITMKNNKSHICILNDNDEIEKVISPKEFDDIAKIILNQNDSEYDNRYINPDVRAMMEEYYKIKYGTINPPNLEKRMAFVSAKTGIYGNNLINMTYREFDMVYKSSLDSELYIGQKIIQGSYKYEIKEDIKHPLFIKKNDPYSEIFEDTSILSNKGISGANQLNTINN